MKRCEAVVLGYVDELRCSSNDSLYSTDDIDDKLITDLSKAISSPLSSLYTSNSWKNTVYYTVFFQDTCTLPPWCRLRSHTHTHTHTHTHRSILHRIQCIPCRMLLHAQQMQATIRVDWLFVKSTQLAAPALVSRHVAILVPVDTDLCRKREWDMTPDHFPLKSFIVKVCQCTIVDVRQIVRWATSTPGYVIVVRGSAVQESDCTLTNSLINDKDNQSVVFDGTVQCVCVCVWCCIVV